MATTRDRMLSCSFCGKNEHQVKKLVAGPATYICDECVVIASRLMRESDAERLGRPWHWLREFVQRLWNRGAARRITLADDHQTVLR